MLPFAILGFVIKPLQLKGVLFCFHSFYIFFLKICMLESDFHFSMIPNLDDRFQ